MFEPNEQRRKDFAALLAYAATLKDGQRLSWLEIQQATGIDMNGRRGRDLFRKAASRAKRPYHPLPGLGVEMSSTENHGEIVSRRHDDVRRAVNRAKQTTTVIIDRHLDAPPQQQQVRLLASQAAIDTLMMSPGLAKSLPAKT
jgi:hypothetical protein